MINIITFDETTKRFSEYTESEWGEEIEWWREQRWPKFEDSIFEFENHEVVQVFHKGKLHVHRIKC